MGITSLSPMEALLVALSGIVTVFMMLVVLIVIIKVVSKAVSATDSKAVPAAAAPAPEIPVPAESVPDETTYGGELLLLGVDEKTAACLMAIVSEETGIPLSQLIFKKIRAIDGGSEK